MIWFDIIVFAAVAVFLAWRLNSVLGERHGDERPRKNPYTDSKSMQETLEAIRETLTEADAKQPQQPAPTLHHAPDSLAGRLAAIQQADPNFNEKGFLTGAKGAFGMIVAAFAAEDTATLRPLLSDDVYDSFSSAIRARQAAKEKLETKILKIKDASIEDASLTLNTAKVTVRLISDQIQATRDATGAVVDGDAARAHEVVDIWTFSRNTRALDPNWQLAETRTEG